MIAFQVISSSCMNELDNFNYLFSPTACDVESLQEVLLLRQVVCPLLSPQQPPLLV